MKTKQIIIVCLTAVMAFSGCKTPKNVEKATGAVEISVPFSESKYRSDKDFFRATQSGKSMDLATAKEKAITAAKSLLASNIQALIKRTTDQYTNSRTVGNKEDFENKFEQLNREVVAQTLSDVQIIGEKVFKETDGTYTYWIAVEDSKQAVLDGLNNSISKNQKLQLDYDKKKYEEIFNAEMEKLEKAK